MVAGSEAYTPPGQPEGRTGSSPAPLPGRWRSRAPHVVTAGAGLLLWRIFFPALMSADSVAQYGQAVTGQLNDWHPPLMAVVLRFVLWAGGGLGLLMLAQCLLGVFGITRLAESCLRFFYEDRIGPGGARWAAVGVLLLLLLPVTPLAFYLMTFWKDSWALVLLLWLMAAALELRLRTASPSLGSLAPAVALGVALAMVRHNAVVVLPLAGLALALSTGTATRRRALTVAVAPLLLYAIAQPALRRAFDVAEMHTEDAIMVLDLVGLCAESAEACGQLPWTRRHVVRPDLLAGYRPGDMGFIYWQQPGPVDLAIARDHSRLRADYGRAIRRFPLLLARVKAEAWAAMLSTERTFYFVHTGIVENSYGLVPSARFAGLRARMTDWAMRVAEHPVLRWISAVHLVWLLVDVLWVAGLLACAWRRRSPRHAFLAVLLSLPLAYYLSYLAATPVHDFRFMLPATVAVQCVTLSWLIGGGLQKPTGRAPYLRRLSA